MASGKSTASTKASGRGKGPRSPSPAKTANVTKTTRKIATPRTKKAVSKAAGDSAKIPAAAKRNDRDKKPVDDADAADASDMEFVEYNSDDNSDDEEVVASKPAPKGKGKGIAETTGTKAKGKGKAPAAKLAAKKPAKGGSRKRKHRSPTPSEDGELSTASESADEDQDQDQEDEDDQDQGQNDNSDQDDDQDDHDDQDGQDDQESEGEGQDEPPRKRKKANCPLEMRRNPHLPLRPHERQKNGRQAGRGLIIWTRPRMSEKLLLMLQYELVRHSIDVPWDVIAHRLHPGSSGSAVQQHLNRLRNAVFAQGHLVPPHLPKAGSRTPVDNNIRGYVRKDMEGSDKVTMKAVKFTERYEHPKFNLPDAFDGSFAGGTAFDDAVEVDDNKPSKKDRQPAKKVISGKAAESTGAGASASASVSTAAKKKKSSTREPTPDPADLPSDADYDPSAKASTQRRKSYRAKSVKSYQEEEAEDEEEEEDVEEVEEVPEVPEIQDVQDGDEDDEKEQMIIKQEQFLAASPTEAVSDVSSLEDKAETTNNDDNPKSIEVSSSDSDSGSDSDDDATVDAMGYEPIEEIVAALEMVEATAANQVDPVLQTAFLQFPGGSMQTPRMSPAMFHTQLLSGNNTDITPSASLSTVSTTSTPGAYFGRAPVPSMHGMSSMPAMQSMPDVTDMPEMPEMHGIPGMPGMTTMAMLNMGHIGGNYSVTPTMLQTEHQLVQANNASGGAIPLYDGTFHHMRRNTASETYDELVNNMQGQINRGPLNAHGYRNGNSFPGGRQH